MILIYRETDSSQTEIHYRLFDQIDIVLTYDKNAKGDQETATKTNSCRYRGSRLLKST